MNRTAPHTAQPLRGLRVAVTRAESPADKLAALLREAGAEPLEYPTIAFVAPTGEQLVALDTALRAAAQDAFDWLLLTSANGARFVAERMQALNLEPAALRGLQVGAVGPATARAIEQQLGLPVARIPERFVAEELAAALGNVARSRILICSADIARPTLGDALAAAGARVTRTVAYCTVPASGGPDMAELLAEGQIDAITFSSGSAARAFVTRIGPELLPAAQRTLIACIGPVTAEAAREVGLAPDVVAEPSTIEGLLVCLAAYVRQMAASKASFLDQKGGTV
jgi:uroporphyrinogen-III synthase